MLIVFKHVFLLFYLCSPHHLKTLIHNTSCFKLTDFISFCAQEVIIR